MDSEMLAGMIFTVVMVLILGGFILLIPLSKHLGRYLASRTLDRAGIGEAAESELRALRAAVEGLDQKLQLVSERQEFLERVLEPHQDELPRLPR